MKVLEILKKSPESQASYGLYRFCSYALARSFADRAPSIQMIVLGDDGKFWVTFPRLAEALVRGGYEYAR